MNEADESGESKRTPTKTTSRNETSRSDQLRGSAEFGDEAQGLAASNAFHVISEVFDLFLIQKSELTKQL